MKIQYKVFNEYFENELEDISTPILTRLVDYVKQGLRIEARDKYSNDPEVKKSCLMGMDFDLMISPTPELLEMQFELHKRKANHE
jgi:hypothetical protein